MERYINSKNVVEDSNGIYDCIDFPRVTGVAMRWTLDFMFVGLCRHYKENNVDAFDEILSNFEAICQSPSLKGAVDKKQLRICAFLARVMHGKQLDTQYEEDDCLMPLVSAAKIWLELEDTVTDKNIFKEITILLLIQSVAVSLENGQGLTASSALKWFKENYDLPKRMMVLLSTIVTERDTYHMFLKSHSFSHLRETIQSFLDDYLKKNPSDYLLKAATKVVQSSKKNGALKDLGKRDSYQIESSKDSPAKEKLDTGQVNHGIKRKLMSRRIPDVWTPESCKKAVICVTRLSEPETSLMSATHKTKAARQKWTPELDQYLKKGIERHGVGKWSRILQDYDFGGRSGTMLKDRWRVLVRTYQAG
ncbi:telomeric repeat-binding factor 1 [Halichoeres trimaculatus]|uniref:telomeric repeat-binding factor 1 n=1 Tax=Halichoeres trimaculatus TaxID=147232 RepID=UPI003D9DCDF0